MNVHELLESLKIRGIRLYLAGGKIRINGKNNPSTDEYREIRYFEKNIVAILQGDTAVSANSVPVPITPKHASEVQDCCILWTASRCVYFDEIVNGIVQVSRWEFDRSPEGKPIARAGDWTALTPDEVDRLDEFLLKWNDVIAGIYSGANDEPYPEITLKTAWAANYRNWSRLEEPLKKDLKGHGKPLSKSIVIDQSKG